MTDGLNLAPAERVDLLVLGAGPAGMAAAVEGRARGLSVLLLDEGPDAGGQVHRALRRRGAGDAGERAGLGLMDALGASGAAVVHGATLWAVEDGERAFWSRDGVAHRTSFGRVVLAPGATERALPIPGWTLPGVMGVGAAQVALKTAGLVPEGRAWIAGQGPLVWLYAVQALRKGGRFAGVLDLSPPGVFGRVAPHLGAAWRGAADLARGLAWRREVRRAGVPVIRAHDVAAIGEERLRAVRFAEGGTDRREEPADLLLLHDGVVPNTQVTRAIPGLEHRWDAGARCWKPALDDWGNATVAGVMVAGDAGGILGASVAPLLGRLAALEAARALGRLDEAARNAAAAPIRRDLSRRRAIRPLLEAAFPPRDLGALPDEVIVCRCEEVTAGRVREAVGLGCLGANQLKAFTRAGMGPCQGRVCGPTVHGVIATARGVPPAEVETFRTRFPTKPLTLGELASLAS